MTGSVIIDGSLAYSGLGVSAQTIIERALKRINVLDPEQTALSAMANDGLEMLNEMLDYWKTKDILAYCVNHNSYAWTTSKTSYTIGPTGADFTAERPSSIIRANFINVATSPDEIIPIEVIEVNEFSCINLRETSGVQPFAIYYQPTSPNGTIYPYPYPENTATVLANKLEIFTKNRLSEFSDLSTEVSLPAGYKHAIITNLAEMLCEPYQKQVPDNLAKQARNARNSISMANSKPLKISTTDTGLPYVGDY